MTADNDLIRRQTALAEIRKEMKKAYTPAGRKGFKQSFDVIRRLPAVKEAPVVRSHWFAASGWWLCYNCGGRSTGGKCTPFCPWCGAMMDELADTEIE